MEIRECKRVDGKGLYSTKEYNVGDVVRVLVGEVYNEPTRDTIHIGNDKHIYDAYGIYINHSFTPNISIVGNRMIAISDIGPDDELTFNYNESELPMAAPFEVDGIMVCGSDDNNNPSLQ